MVRRFAFITTFALASAFGAVACTSSQNALLQKGDLCDEDIQCAAPYVCACVLTRPTGEDGSDEVVAHGTCQNAGFKCKSDGGVDSAMDGNPPDTTPIDSGSDAGATDATDATDATSSDTTDAADTSDGGGGG